MTEILGIDPGLSGGLAHLHPAGMQLSLVQVYQMPRRNGRADWDGLQGILESLARSASWSVALEKMAPFPGIKNTTALLVNYGRLIQLLHQTGMPVVEYYPQQWQASFRMRRGGTPRRLRVSDIQGDKAKEKVAANRNNKLKSESMANALYPEAAKRFGRFWASGTQEAALIGTHHHQTITLPAR